MISSPKGNLVILRAPGDFFSEVAKKKNLFLHLLLVGHRQGYLVTVLTSVYFNWVLRDVLFIVVVLVFLLHLLLQIHLQYALSLSLINLIFLCLLVNYFASKKQTVVLNPNYRGWFEVA
jgi:hypothetical protein